MGLTKTEVKIPGDAYNENSRYRVGAIVEYLGATFQNVTGVNSTPSASSNNWILTKAASALTRPIILLFGNPFFLIKAPSNNDPLKYNTIQNNDMVADGFFDDTRFWNKAICIDESNLISEASFNIIDEIEEIVTI